MLPPPLGNRRLEDGGRLHWENSTPACESFKGESLSGSFGRGPDVLSCLEHQYLSLVKIRASLISSTFRIMRGGTPTMTLIVLRLFSLTLTVLTWTKLTQPSVSCLNTWTGTGTTSSATTGGRLLSIPLKNPRILSQSAL